MLLKESNVKINQKCTLICMYIFSYLSLLSVSDFEKVKFKVEMIELSYSSIKKNFRKK